MTTSVQELLNQLRVAIGKLDEAAVIAKRAQIDAQETHAQFVNAGLGTNHPHMVKAKADADVAAAKAGKLARLYAEAAAAYTRYVNHVAPGTVPDRRSAPESMPAGDRLVEDAGERGARGEAFLRKQIQNLGDARDAVEQAERLVDAVKDVIRALRSGPPGNTTATTAPAEPLPQQRPHLDNPVTAAVMAAGAIAAAGKTAVDQTRKRATRKKRTDDDHA